MEVLIFIWIAISYVGIFMKSRVCIAFASFLIITFFSALFCIYLVSSSISESVLAQTKANSMYTLSIGAQVHYRRQAQKWKNILLRGHNKTYYDKYLIEFLAEGDLATDKIVKLQRQLPDNAECYELVNEFLIEYPKVEAKYLDALASNYDTSQFIYRRITETDAKVKGIDTELDDLLDLLSEHLLKGSHIEIVSSKKQREFIYSVIIILVTALLLGINITFFRLMRKQVQYLTIDTVTRLNNKLVFEQFIDRYTSKKELFIILINIDNFKLINSTFGYSAGSRYLREIGILIKGNIAVGDRLFKFNSDEFIFVSFQDNTDKVEATCRRIQLKIENYAFAYEENVFQTTCSASIVKNATGKKSIEEIYNLLFLSMQEAKDLGKGSLVLYASSDKSIANRQKEMESINEINTAFDQKLFTLYKQQISAFTHRDHLSYFEVLIRLKKLDSSVISPGCFLPAAEKYNLMGKIDRWVITELCSYLNSYPSDQYHYAVNLSGDTLSDVSFIDFIKATFSTAQFSPDRVRFEITESQAIKNIETTNKILSELKTYGCKIALDDFGKGESSLSNLTTMNIDSVKIDGEFVKGLTNSNVNQTVITSIVKIAKALNISTVAEFIENEEVKEILVDIGVDYGQGFFIHKPESLY